MSRECSITGAKPTKGHIIHRRGMAKKKGGVGQHVTANTPRVFTPNLKTKRIWVPELNRFVTVKLTARALKTISKNGAFQTLKKAGLVAPWRGMKGGYTLAKPAEVLSLLEVLQALDDPAVRPYAVAKGKDSAEQKAVAKLMGAAEASLSEALGTASLADLKREAQALPDLKSAPRRGAGFQI